MPADTGNRAADRQVGFAVGSFDGERPVSPFAILLDRADLIAGSYRAHRPGEPPPGEAEHEQPALSV